MSTTIKRTKPDAATIVTLALFDLPDDFIAAELPKWLERRHKVVLRWVCRAARQRVTLPSLVKNKDKDKENRHVKEEPSFAETFVADRTTYQDDHDSHTMINWLRTGCPPRWFSRRLWLHRAARRAELDLLDDLCPATMVVSPDRPSMAILRHAVLGGAALARDPEVANWLHKKGLLDTDNVESLLWRCAKPPAVFGPVARAACLLFEGILSPDTIEITANVCAERDDANFIAFLDNYDRSCDRSFDDDLDNLIIDDDDDDEESYAPEIAWQDIATFCATEHGSMKVLAWAFARSKDPLALFSLVLRLIADTPLTHIDTNTRVATLQQALDTHCALRVK